MMKYESETLTEAQIKELHAAFYADAAAIKAYCKMHGTSCDGCPFMKVDFSGSDWCKLNFPEKWEV